MSWESTSGSWKFYKNGNLREEGIDLMKGYKITQGGSLVLGQGQDSVGGGFQIANSFQGMLSNVNVWDRVLYSYEIEKMSTSCLLDEWRAGNIYRWRNFLQGARPTSLAGLSTCESLGIDTGSSLNWVLSMVRCNQYFIRVFSLRQVERRSSSNTTSRGYHNAARL